MFSIDSFDLTNYRIAHNDAVAKLKEWYADHSSDNAIADYLWNAYREHHLDPDGKATRMFNNTLCSADALISIFRICKMEKNSADIISTYQHYTYIPIFYFPMEMGGINQTRARVYGDRIDYTLYDLKTALDGERSDCRLLSAYERNRTAVWLDGFQCFDDLLAWYGIKGIFTDNQGRVLNIDTGKPILEMPPAVRFSAGWSQRFYDHLKLCIDRWYNANKIDPAG